MDNFLAIKKKRRTLIDIPIAPILDMLVAVIFFLLLSTTFIQFTREAVPPAKISTVQDPISPPPIAGKMFVYRFGSRLKLVLSWEGNNPGFREVILDGTDPARYTAATLKSVSDLAKGFKEQFPNEQTIQVGLNKDGSYQDLITVMDAVVPHLPDVVLVSYMELAEFRRGE